MGNITVKDSKYGQMEVTIRDNSFKERKTGKESGLNIRPILHRIAMKVNI